MAGNGSIVFFSTAPGDPRARMDAAVEALRLTGLRSASRYRDHSWDHLQRMLRDELSSIGPDDSVSEYKFVSYPKRLGDVMHLLDPTGRRCFMIRVAQMDSPVLREVWDEAERIPPEIIGDFRPGNDGFIRVGEHDIFECVENDSGTLFGRATFSVAVCGYGCPTNWPAAREALWNLKAIQELGSALEPIMPDCQRCIYWEI